MSRQHVGYPFEHTKKPLLDIPSYRRRQFTYFLYAVLLISVSLGIGMAGYRYFTGMDWITAFYNASMILTGMGPADPMPTAGAKLFAGVYSLFSGVIFLGTIAILFAPMIHRFFHRIHLDV